jgi:hypothetical protein
MSLALSEQLNNWEAQRAQRVQLGDDLAAPRMIDHVVAFKRRSSARSAAAAYEANGFTVRLNPGMLKTTIEASRVDALTETRVAELLRETVGIAEAHGGLYDGFGGTIVPESAGA